MQLPHDPPPREAASPEARLWAQPRAPCLPKTLALHTLLEGRSSKCSEGDEAMRPRARSPGKKDKHLEAFSLEKALGNSPALENPRAFLEEDGPLVPNFQEELSRGLL